MKKLLFSMLLLAIGFSAMAQQSIQLRSSSKAECVKSDMTGFKASFAFSSLDAQQIQTTRGELTELHIEGTFPNGNVGEPQLPMFTRLIAVPTGATPVVTVGAHSETDYTLSDYGMGTVAAMQAPVRKNIDPSTVEYAFSETAYARNSYNDDPIAKVEVLGTMRGITLGRLIVQPVRYNPVAGTVKVFNDIEVSVDFQNGDAASTARMFKNTSSPAFNSVYNQIFNFDMLTGGTRDAYTDHPDLYNTPVKMLVICYSGFKNNEALNSWLQWKLQKGYYVDIHYTDETGTTASAIASFIKTKYNASVSAGNAYTYLIVIGDTGQVPYYQVDYEDSTAGYVASDLGYASVDFSTNSNDVFPDMYYSRMSVENTTHLTNYINKVLTYEKYEFTDGGNYLNNVILVGGWDDDWTSIVARPTINYATTYYFNSSNTTYGGFSGGTIKATISTSSTQGYSGNNNGCYQGINNGACFVNYTAHGNKQEWSQPLFTAAQVATLTNTGKYFFAVGNCCLSGNYNNTSTSYSPGSAIGANACFGETMIRVPNAGAIAYIGCSDYTIWMEDYYWAVGSGIHFNSNYDLQGTATTSNTTTGVYDAMFRDDYWNSASSLLFVGNIAVTAAENNSNGYDTDAGYKYYFKYYHTFGDGSVMPYVTKPETNTVTLPSTVTPGASSATINALAGSYVAVTDNNSVIYGVGVANSSGVATVNFTNAIPNSGTLNVVVTRQQYQPYFGTIQVVGSGTQYTITANVNPTTGGTVEGAGQYYENTNCTLTAVPNHGFAFQRWNDNNTDNPRTITVTGNATYTAIFRALEEHHINYTAQQTHGSISVSPTDAIMGDIVSLTATPEAGFALDQWNVNTVSKGNVPVENNQFVMPDSEVTVSATFRVADPLTVADGSGSNSEVPFYALYSDDNYQHTQTIYPSSMLTEMQGMQITKLTYYTNSTTSKTFSSTYEVRFATTTSTSFSSGTVNYISVTSSPVYSGSLTNQSSSIVEISLTTPYTYTGGNLVVDVRSTALGSGYQSMNFIGESGSTYYSVKNRSTSSVPTTSGTAVSFMPKITFTYEVPQPYISLSPTSATIITGNTQSLTASYGNVTNPTITYTSSNTSVARVTGNGTSATVTGIAPGTATITATMNGSYTATCAITVEDPSYCTPNPSSVDGKGITSLTFGSGDYVVNNSNSNGLPSSSPYYADYTSMVGAAEAGQQVTVNITYSTGSGTVYSYGTIIWVDWDKDYEFEDSEIVKTGTSAQGSGGTSQQLTLSFTVPANQAADDYRMRIAGADSYFDSFIGGSTSANHSPCFSSTYAVCHDYTLRVAAGNPCGTPTNLQASQVGTTTAHLSWDGTNDSYVLQYRTAAQDMNMSVWQEQGDDIEAPGEFTQLEFDLSEYSGTGYIAIRHYACSGQWQMTIDDVVVTDANGQTVASADFNDGSIPSGWVNLDYDNDGHLWQIANFGDDAGCQHGAYCLMSASYASGVDLTPDNYLIIPNVELGGTLSFYVCSTDAGWPENFGVFVATQSYEGVPAGEWSAEIPASTTSKDLTGLTANTPYEWRVKGICTGMDPSNWATSSFTTIAEGFKTFITEGDWDVANNWFPVGVPANTDEVTIEAPVTIRSGVVATAKKVTLNGGSVLIKDGGQLKHSSFTLKATMEKEITGYGESTGKDHYYFIATPLTGTTKLGYTSGWNYVTNVNVNNYDFYWFDGSQAHEEWQNYEALSSSDATDFTMNPNVGYLYANSADKTLQFVGNIKGTNNPTTVDITFDETSTTPFNGWSLVGNPYSCNAYLSYVDNNGGALEANFYTLNNSGTYSLVSTSNPLTPCAGALINYSATGKVQFSSEAPAKSTGMLNMNLVKGNKTVDQARVRFGEGYNLKHMSFRNNSKLYMPVENNDYAVVYSEEQNEMPVNFKAEENGSYTLSFNTENVELGYLHLIDNMTGIDVDLLATPSYSFNAKTTDYESRFKLVFATGNSTDDTFAFFSNGSFVINNEGEATLQVIDVNGRILKSESINGCANVNVNAAQGIYMLRLVNGDNVKVQKVVVK